MLKTTTFTLALLLSQTAFADISYDYVQGAYGKLTDSGLGFDVDADAFAVSGSFSATPDIAITASYADTSYDRFYALDSFGNILNIDTDATELNVGVTLHGTVAPDTDLYGNFSNFFIVFSKF